jgi:hypothetical protein
LHDDPPHAPHDPSHASPHACWLLMLLMHDAAAWPMSPQLLMHHAPQPHACTTTTVAPTETPTGVSIGAPTAGAFYYLLRQLCA